MDRFALAATARRFRATGPPHWRPFVARIAELASVLEPDRCSWLEAERAHIGRWCDEACDHASAIAERVQRLADGWWADSRDRSCARAALVQLGEDLLEVRSIVELSLDLVGEWPTLLERVDTTITEVHRVASQLDAAVLRLPPRPGLCTDDPQGGPSATWIAGLSSEQRSEVLHSLVRAGSLAAARDLLDALGEPPVDFAGRSLLQTARMASISLQKLAEVAVSLPITRTDLVAAVQQGCSSAELVELLAGPAAPHPLDHDRLTDESMVGSTHRHRHYHDVAGACKKAVAAFATPRSHISALYAATDRGDLSQVQSLIDNAHTRPRSSHHVVEFVACLMCAVHHDDPACLAALLKLGPPGDEGMQALLRYAALCASMPVLTLLLSIEHANALARDEWGESAVSIGVRRGGCRWDGRGSPSAGDVAVSEALLVHALGCSIEPLDLAELLSCAAEAGNERACQRLLDAGADPVLEAQPGRSALSRALSRSHGTISQLLMTACRATERAAERFRELSHLLAPPVDVAHAARLPASLRDWLGAGVPPPLVAYRGSGEPLAAGSWELRLALGATADGPASRIAQPAVLLPGDAVQGRLHALGEPLRVEVHQGGTDVSSSTPCWVRPRMRSAWVSGTPADLEEDDSAPMGAAGLRLCSQVGRGPFGFDLSIVIRHARSGHIVGRARIPRLAVLGLGGAVPRLPDTLPDALRASAGAALELLADGGDVSPGPLSAAYAWLAQYAWGPAEGLSLQSTLTIPLVCSRTPEPGMLTLRLLLVRPFTLSELRPTADWAALSRCWATSPQLVGHRGSGSDNAATVLITDPETGSVRTVRRTHVLENTVLSFVSAADRGAQLVEFDVHLSADGIPVIHHDFDVRLPRGSRMPVSHLSADQLCSHVTPRAYVAGPPPPPVTGAWNGSVTRMKPRTSALPTQGRAWESPAMAGLTEPALPPRAALRSSDRQLAALGVDGTVCEWERDQDEAGSWFLKDRFTTLARALRVTPSCLGFNVEMKYPSDDEIKCQGLVVPDRNTYVDRILEVLMTHVCDRDIVFSSFDPEVCVLLSRKQASFPVLLLTEAGEWVDSDPRRNSLRTAIRYAWQTRLFGIVSDSKPLLISPCLIRAAQDVGLAVATYGRGNNRPECVLAQCLCGVGALIADHVAHIAQTTGVGRTGVE